MTELRAIWICWPNPDKVCLQGGCGYCGDALRKTKMSDVRTYAIEKGWAEDLDYGLTDGNHESRARRSKPLTF